MRQLTNTMTNVSQTLQRPRHGSPPLPPSPFTQQAQPLANEAMLPHLVPTRPPEWGNCERDNYEGSSGNEGDRSNPISWQQCRTLLVSKHPQLVDNAYDRRMATSAMNGNHDVVVNAPP
jgi:hypothetical protein